MNLGMCSITPLPVLYVFEFNSQMESGEILLTGSARLYPELSVKNLTLELGNIALIWWSIFNYT